MHDNLYQDFITLNVFGHTNKRVQNFWNVGIHFTTVMGNKKKMAHNWCQIFQTIYTYVNLQFFVEFFDLKKVIQLILIY